MVWHGKVETEQGDDGADQPFGLPQRQAVRGSAFHAAMAASVNQIVRLPR